MSNKEEPGPVPPQPLFSGVGGSGKAIVSKDHVTNLFWEFPTQSKSHGDPMQIPWESSIPASLRYSLGNPDTREIKWLTRGHTASHGWAKPRPQVSWQQVQCFSHYNALPLTLAIHFPHARIDAADRHTHRESFFLLRNATSYGEEGDSCLIAALWDGSGLRMWNIISR